MNTTTGLTLHYECTCLDKQCSLWKCIKHFLSLWLSNTWFLKEYQIWFETVLCPFWIFYSVSEQILFSQFSLTVKSTDFYKRRLQNYVAQMPESKSLTTNLVAILSFYIPYTLIIEFMKIKNLPESNLGLLKFIFSFLPELRIYFPFTQFGANHNSEAI